MNSNSSKRLQTQNSSQVSTRVKKRKQSKNLGEPERSIESIPHRKTAVLRKLKPGKKLAGGL